jgi:hypothetical protein
MRACLFVIDVIVILFSLYLSMRACLFVVQDLDRDGVISWKEFETFFM